MHEYGQALLLVLVGGIAGFLNVVAGGGSLLTLPVMVFMGVPGSVANGTNRIAILLQSITALIFFARKGLSDVRLSASLALATLPGTMLGAYMGTRLDGVWFNRVLAGIMLCILLLTLFERQKTTPVTKEIHSTPGRRLVAHLSMMGVGFYGGFIQVGVGFIIMPILQRVLGMDLVRVNMHKVFITGFYTLVALWIFASQLQLMWLMGACLGLGNAVGGWFGAHVSVAKGEAVIRYVLHTVLVAFIIKLIFISGY